MSAATIILLTLSAIAAACGQLLFKVGARDASELTDFINAPIVVGLILYGSATALWIYALSYAKLVNVYAFTALTFALVYAGGVLILGEKLSYPGIVGIGFVLTGLYLITAFNS